MRIASAPASPATSGFLGILKSWLRGKSGETWQPSGDVPGGAARPDARRWGAVRVLVADDNPVNLMVVSGQMELRGLVPLLAADGAEAVALACEMQFDLILMDLQMPILDGLEATTAIRRFESTSSRPAVPVIAYTSASPGAGVLAAHGMNGILVKPCEGQDLEDCLLEWCPTYRERPTARDLQSDNTFWQAAHRSSSASGVSMR